MQARQRCRMELTNVWRVFWGIACHSCCRIWNRTLRFGGGGWFARIRRPRTSQRCSIGLRSGEREGQSILITCCCCRKLLTTRALCGRVLSSCNITPGPTAWRADMAMGRRMSSMYAMPVRLPSTRCRGVLWWRLKPSHTIRETPPCLSCSRTVASRKRSPGRLQTRIRSSLKDIACSGTRRIGAPWTTAALSRPDDAGPRQDEVHDEPWWVEVAPLAALIACSPRADGCEQFGHWPGC